MEEKAAATKAPKEHVAQPITQPMSPPEKHTPKSPLLWFGVGLLAVVIGGGYYMLSNRTPPVTQPPTSTPIASIATSPIIDLTAGWYIYTDERYGYQINYPSNWYVRPTAKEGYGAAAVFTNYDLNQASEKTGFTKDMIKIEISQVDKNADTEFLSWATDQVQETLQSSVNKDYGMQLGKQEPYSKNNLIGVKYLFKYKSLPPSLSIYLLKNKTQVYQITVNPANSRYIDEFDLILSTFRFVE